MDGLSKMTNNYLNLKKKIRELKSLQLQKLSHKDLLLLFILGLVC